MTSRRSVLQALTILPLMNACTNVNSSSVSVPSLHYTPSGLPLRRVRVSEQRVIRTVSGLRPFRKAGFVVKGERLNDKTLVHNYGHGGGGITLSWGTSHQAMEIAQQAFTQRRINSDRKECAVIGCGVMGLTSARLLQNQGWDVTIYAKALPPYTTSNIAGGQWSPASVYEDDSLTADFQTQFAQAMELSYRYFQNLVGPKYGVRWISNYRLSDSPGPTDALVHNYPSMYPQLKILGKNEHPFPVEFATHYDTMLIEPAVFLTQLMSDFRNAGGRIKVREFANITEISNLPQQTVINCSGLGARELFADNELFPIKGQLSFVLPQEEVDYITITENTYMFPRSDGILLGGTFEYNNWDLTPDPLETARILKEHQAFFSGMKDPWG
ncbi:MAG: FAD-dependent oxidoreductase [Pseudohongiellaceae bacterium]